MIKMTLVSSEWSLILYVHTFVQIWARLTIHYGNYCLIRYNLVSC